MSIITWPHGRLPQALCDVLVDATAAAARVYTLIPRDRTYPLLTVQGAGLGPMGTDSHISADQPRIQIDCWATREDGAGDLAAEVKRLLDFRYPDALRDRVLTTADEAEEGRYYESKVERIECSGGGDVYLDTYARVWRVTQFYNVKVNL